METVNESLGILRRQAEIEQSMKKSDGIRITEEQELLLLKRRLANYRTIRGPCRRWCRPLSKRPPKSPLSTAGLVERYA